MPSRRTFLATAGAALGLSAAGCLGSDSSGRSGLAEALYDGTDWPGPGHDQANTAYSPEGVVVDEPTVGWESTFDAPLSGFSVADGTIYVPGDPLRAVDVESGEERFTRPETETWIQPIVEDGSVFAVDSAGTALVRLAADDGSELWEAELPDDVRVRSPPSFDYDRRTLFVGAQTSGESPSDRLYGIDVETGEVDWSRDVFGRIDGTPAVTGPGLIVVTTRAGMAYAFGRTGGALWKRNLSARIRTAPIQGKNRVYVGTQGSVYALDSNTGETEWKRSVRGLPQDAMAFDGERVYARAGPSLYAIDAADGDVDWEYDGNLSRCTPAVVDGLVYVATDDGDVVALDADGGGFLDDGERWRLSVGEYVGYWTAVTDERVYVRTRREDEDPSVPIVAIENR